MPLTGIEIADCFDKNTVFATLFLEKLIKNAMHVTLKQSLSDLSRTSAAAISETCAKSMNGEVPKV